MKNQLDELNPYLGKYDIALFSVDLKYACAELTLPQLSAFFNDDYQARADLSDTYNRRFYFKRVLNYFCRYYQCEMVLHEINCEISSITSLKGTHSGGKQKVFLLVNTGNVGAFSSHITKLIKLFSINHYLILPQASQQAHIYGYHPSFGKVMKPYDIAEVTKMSEVFQHYFARVQAELVQVIDEHKVIYPHMEDNSTHKNEAEVMENFLRINALEWLIQQEGYIEVGEEDSVWIKTERESESTLSFYLVPSSELYRYHYSGSSPLGTILTLDARTLVPVYASSAYVGITQGELQFYMVY